MSTHNEIQISYFSEIYFKNEFLHYDGLETLLIHRNTGISELYDESVAFIFRAELSLQ